MERLVLSWVGKPLAFELMPGLNRLGRNPTNDFRIADASISSFHCEVTLNPNGIVHIRDLASTNGTYINGLQTLEGDLRAGQSLRLGTVELQLERVNVADPIHVPEPVAAGGGDHHAEIWAREEKPKSFFGKLTQTMKIGFKR
jgi:predicted component of type VI protein secretion system